jgi:hypothetical protein
MRMGPDASRAGSLCASLSRLRAFCCPTDIENFVAVQRLAGHRFFNRLGKVLRDGGDERDRAILEDTVCPVPRQLTSSGFKHKKKTYDNKMM